MLNVPSAREQEQAGILTCPNRCSHICSHICVAKPFYISGPKMAAEVRSAFKNTCLSPAQCGTGPSVVEYSKHWHYQEAFPAPSHVSQQVKQGQPQFPSLFHTSLRYSCPYSTVLDHHCFTSRYSSKLELPFILINILTYELMQFRKLLHGPFICSCLQEGAKFWQLGMVTPGRHPL